MDENRSIILIRDVTMLDRLLTMRQDFIANVSHELRTPLTVIIGYLEALEDDDIDQDMLHTLLGRLPATGESHEGAGGGPAYTHPVGIFAHTGPQRIWKM